MKGKFAKILMICLLLSCWLTGKAEDTGTEEKSDVRVQIGTIEQISVTDYVDILDGVDGFIFVGVGEKRDVSRTLGRENDENTTAGGLDQDGAKALNWTTLNKDIVTVDENGMIEGIKYGESIIQGIGEGVDLAYVVFVCPKVTIKSPEGAVYSYHKIYNQQTRVQFTHSPEYVINSVMRFDRSDYSDGRDITTTEGRIEGEKFDSATGWYTSQVPMTSDVIFHVTLEKRGQSDNVVSDSNVKVNVLEKSIFISGLSEELKDEPITVVDMWRKVKVDRNKANEEGIREILIQNDGIYEVRIPNDNTYKIIII